MSACSRWLLELDRQVMRGKHVVLHGNVMDYCLWRGEVHTVTRALQAYLGSPEPGQARSGTPQPQRFTVVAPFDLARGLLVPEAARPILFPGADRPPSRIPGLFEAVEGVNTLLTQEQVGTAAVVHYGDRMVSDPERQMETELRALQLLKECTQNAAQVLGDEAPRSRKNLLVVVAGHLQSLPEWFYKDNPWVALVKVQEPSEAERRFFLRALRSPFRFQRGPGRLDGEAAERLLPELVDHTDGLKLCELEMLRRMSLSEEVPVEEPKKLCDLFKYGEKENPWERLDRRRIEEARAILGQRVIGQDVVVDKMVELLKAAKVGIDMSPQTAQSGRPRGVLFFVGPTGVGKTEMAKALTELIFRDESAFERFDMSEYSAEHSAARLTGSEPGYVGYHEGGKLTNRVLEKPFSVLLFDEIEKAHGKILDKFLQVFEDGRLTDGQGRTAYFSETLLIFTSNIGSAAAGAASAATEAGQYEVLRQGFLDAVHDYFVRELGRPELLSRLGDNILVFDVLREEHVQGITDKLLRQLAASAQRKYRLDLRPDRSVFDFVRERMRRDGNIRYGGRRIKSLLETHVERPLNAALFDRGLPEGRRVALSMDGDRLEVRL